MKKISKAKELSIDLLNFINNSPTMYHSTNEVSKCLERANFTALDLKEHWKLNSGESYYVKINDSAIFAFVLGKAPLDKTGFKLIGAHTDSPGFRLKPNPIIREKGYLRLNTEVYGGPILNTWLDRPLSIAGRVIIENKGQLITKLVNIDRDLLIIPNLAIHMNRKINKGFELNPQIHTLPIFLYINEEEDISQLIEKLVANSLNVDKSKIIDMDLYLYSREIGSLLGLHDELISVGRQDNLNMVHSSLKALINHKDSEKTIGVFYTDNEEVGSRTIQGANSTLLSTILSRIAFNQNLDYESYQIALAKSFMISADMAHAYHPNFKEASDPTNQPIINKGPVLKIAANKSYITDGYSASIIKKLCKNGEIPYQFFTNRSNKAGGSTIGPITEGVIHIKGIDLGNALWAMHSVREVGGVLDHYYIYKLFNQFFK